LLEQSQYTSLISWIEDGAAFRIHDPTRFSEELLPQYFKHRNWSSFIRQLNMYQFQKVSPKGSYKQRRASQPHACDFRHPDFHRDHKEWLPNIKRKTPRNRSIFQYAATMVDPPPPQDDGDEDEIPGPHPGSVPHLRQQPDPPSQASPPLHPSANVAMLLDRFSSRMTSLTLRVEDVERDLFEVRGIMEQQEHASRITLLS
ncbi:HSF-type DNA-binding-domain-containing protein, partial [Syncephalastrum racemosum]